jgi:type II secretory pathway pseudopilin PulG
VETNMQNSFSRPQRSHGASEGFSILEMVVAMLVLTVGLLGVASAIGYALMASNSGRGITNAKLLVVSALEQMETLRNTNQLNFDEISNSHVNGSSFQGFPDTFMAVSSVPGNDGIFGTADDISTAPGPDGKYGTTDDIKNENLIVKGVKRQVLITSPSQTLKKIKVTLRYAPNGGPARELVGISFLNDDRHGNYVP